MPTKPDTTPPATGADEGDVLLRIRDLQVHFELQGSFVSRLTGRDVSTVKAVDGVSLDLHRGEVLGLVGESGSGKTTLGRTLLRLVRPTGGSVHYGDVDLASLSERDMRPLRRRLQMVFQDPHASLNPSMDIEHAVGHPLRIHKVATDEADVRRRVAAALERVGLSPVDRFLSTYPSDLSGGQKQRAVIARAIILGPELLVADEPVSMLDMSVRAKILELMLDLRRDLGLTYVYITHDLATAKFFCDRVAIMYLGRIVEVGRTEDIFAAPKHPYTQALLRAIPEPDPERTVPRDLPRGEVPDAAAPPLGCSFHPRCPLAFAPCGWESRDLRALLEARWTTLDDLTYEQESALFADLGELDAATQRAVVTPAAGHSADELLAVMDRWRSDVPDEPMWRGVRAMAVENGALVVSFHAALEPRLRATDDVEVACHLHDPDLSHLVARRPG